MCMHCVCIRAPISHYTASIIGVRRSPCVQKAQRKLRSKKTGRVCNFMGGARLGIERQRRTNGDWKKHLTSSEKGSFLPPPTLLVSTDEGREWWGWEGEISDPGYGLGQLQRPQEGGQETFRRHCHQPS